MSRRLLAGRSKERPAFLRLPPPRRLLLLLALFAAVAAWRYDTAAGLTVCVPGYGPIVWLAPDIYSAHYGGLHEQAHAEQIRAAGCLRWYASMPWSAQRLAWEAEAHCAEIATVPGVVAGTVSREDVVEVATDATMEHAALRWRFGEARIREAVARACG